VRNSPYRRRVQALGFLFFLVVLASGLLLGTQSSLTLERNASGSVAAVNAWRFAGIPLIRRTVSGLREVRIVPMSVSSRDLRSAAYHEMWGRRVIPERVVLVGDGQLEYPYREDVSLIRSFLANPHNARVELTQPIDVRREASSWVLLSVAVLSTIGWIWQRIGGRDPLSGASRTVTPLPPALGGAVFVGGILVLLWFFTVGHRIVGPIATRKVQLLMQSAAHDNADGIASAVRQGVFVDARDDQDMSALMIAARSGAAQAVDTLIRAGANQGLRDLNDNTALMWAIQTRHMGLAVRLLDAGSGVEDADANGRTALHIAAEAGDPTVTRRLIEAGARIDQADAHGWTPLFFAAASGNADTVAALIDAGATPTAKLPDGRTAADLARSDDVLQALRTTQPAQRTHGRGS
jgi:ankyrin repeat protein